MQLTDEVRGLGGPTRGSTPCVGAHLPGAACGLVGAAHGRGAGLWGCWGGVGWGCIIIIIICIIYSVTWVGGWGWCFGGGWVGGWVGVAAGLCAACLLRHAPGSCSARWLAEHLAQGPLAPPPPPGQAAGTPAWCPPHGAGILPICRWWLVAGRCTCSQVGGGWVVCTFSAGCGCRCGWCTCSQVAAGVAVAVAAARCTSSQLGMGGRLRPERGVAAGLSLLRPSLGAPCTQPPSTAVCAAHLAPFPPPPPPICAPPARRNALVGGAAEPADGGGSAAALPAAGPGGRGV